jgi:hypothetical protein
MHDVEQTGISGVCVVHYTKENKHMKAKKEFCQQLPSGPGGMDWCSIRRKTYFFARISSPNSKVLGRCRR